MNKQEFIDELSETLHPDYRNDEWECIDMDCTHWDGDMCTLGFCEPDILGIDLDYVEEVKLIDKSGLVNMKIKFFAHASKWDLYLIPTICIGFWDSATIMFSWLFFHLGVEIWRAND